MIWNAIITENQLDEWVRGNASIAQGVIVELVWRLVAASSPRPKERRFPLGDSIGQPGPDGTLNTEFGYAPFVPEGKSVWEIGTGVKAGGKATKDYKDCTRDTPQHIRQESTFIFVTPLSGRRDWQYTWKEVAQEKWVEDRRRRKNWRDVHILDGSRIVDWMHHFPAVEKWMAVVMGLPAQRMETPEQRWDGLRSVGEPPPLTPHIFLIGRERARERLDEVFTGSLIQLRLDTRFPDQVVDFVCASIADMDEQMRVDTLGRCLVVSDADAWDVVVTLPDRHILIADFDLDEANTAGTRLLERARRGGHAVIFGGAPGGIPHPNRVAIPGPRSHQIKEALEKAGYNEERARVLGQKTDGNISALLRCLQNLSLMPEWAQDSDAAELAIAELLGAWHEKSEPDKAIVEQVAKKAYGEWIDKMREVALRPGTPLTHCDGAWKLVARYEGWYALGPKVFDEHLAHFKDSAITVLRERDPKFELSSDERYMANVRGKVLPHSHLLRNGLAGTLALLGSHPKALTSCSLGGPEAIAVAAVREILAGADWVLWGSLDRLLPLLAEAAPDQFLDAVENSLRMDPCPFDELFAQEGRGLFGLNYLSGLLWALETLAWDERMLTRVVVLLGELAERDPGGNWANRPLNSLATILLPWLPQTCASVARRKTAVEALVRECPGVAWTLLLAFLPSSHQMSSGSRKPEWRELIPSDWSKEVTVREYWEQVAIYVALAENMAKTDLSRLGEFIEHLDNLPKDDRDRILEYLQSDEIVSLTEVKRLPLWTQLARLAIRHRKFADAKWAMESDEVQKVATAADRLAPQSPELRHRRLFSHGWSDLFEEKGHYQEQRDEIEERRRDAVDEIWDSGGIKAILEFAKAVESPRPVGMAFGSVANNEVDRVFLPEQLGIGDKRLSEFMDGFVWGRFSSLGWEWVDAVDISLWSPAQIGAFLVCLPFEQGTWERAGRLLGRDESLYWTKVPVYPYGDKSGLEVATDRLVQYGRPYAAIRCLAAMCEEQQLLDSKRVVRVLMSEKNPAEDSYTTDAHDLRTVIKALQENPNTEPDDLFQVEWAYLPLLEHDEGISPKYLEERLAVDPKLFCQAIRIVYRSTREKESTKEVSQQEKDMGSNTFRLLHNWRRPPGLQEDGTFDGEALSVWLAEVKSICEESGHLEVALLTVGHVLTYAPHDPDGLWIHRAAADILNAHDANAMRDGFTTQKYNSRGLHEFTSGQEERTIATEYRQKADEVEIAGYHRFATALRGLADQYEREADREEARDPYDRL